MPLALDPLGDLRDLLGAARGLAGLLQGLRRRAQISGGFERPSQTSLAPSLPVRVGHYPAPLLRSLAARSFPTICERWTKMYKRPAGLMRSAGAGEVEPVGEQPARGSGASSSAAALDLGEECGALLLPEGARERVAVRGDLGPLARHLGRHLEVELDPVGALAGQRTPGWRPRASSASRTAPSGSSKVSPCHCSDDAAAPRCPANSGSLAALSGQLDRQQPDLRALQRRTCAPSAAASSCTPRQTPRKGRPASTASRTSRFSSREPGMLGIVAGAHRPAHRQHARRTRASPAAPRPRRARPRPPPPPAPASPPRRRPGARRRCAGGRVAASAQRAGLARRRPRRLPSSRCRV